MIPLRCHTVNFEEVQFPLIDLSSLCVSQKYWWCALYSPMATHTYCTSSTHRIQNINRLHVHCCVCPPPTAAPCSCQPKRVVSKQNCYSQMRCFRDLSHTNLYTSNTLTAPQVVVKLRIIVIYNRNTYCVLSVEDHLTVFAPLVFVLKDAGIGCRLTLPNYCLPILKDIKTTVSKHDI